MFNTCPFVDGNTPISLYLHRKVENNAKPHRMIVGLFLLYKLRSDVLNNDNASIDAKQFTSDVPPSVNAVEGKRSTRNTKIMLGID